MALRRASRSVVPALAAIAALLAFGAPAAGADSGDLAPPLAAGTSGANIDLSDAERRVMLRWVARRSGLLRVMHMRIEAGGADCRSDVRPGYGLGNGGSWHVTTHPVLADGRPDTSTTLATQELRPCAGPNAVVDVHRGTVRLALDLLVTKGQEYATVVRNGDADPAANFTSTNFLYSEDGLAGANSRNERDPDATDAYYGLDPRELVGFSWDGGRNWTMPGTAARTASRGYLATYIQEFADGTLAGQPYYYSSPATSTKAMVYPNVPVRWTIRALGAYTHLPGAGTLTLFVDGAKRAAAAVEGPGMVRAAIDPVTVLPGQDVKVVNEGLSIHGIVADGAWGVLLGMNLPTKKWYLEGAGSFSWAAPVYPLPWYGADQGSPVPQGPAADPPTNKAPTTTAPTSKPPTGRPQSSRPQGREAQRRRRAKAACRASKLRRATKRQRRAARLACAKARRS